MVNGKLDSANVEDNIRILMYKHDLSIGGFAREIGVHMRCIRSILEGLNKARIDTIIKIAETFDVSIDWLCSKNR